MVAELCPWKELQPRAFSIMPLVYSIGSVFGPAIGGALSNPLNQDPTGPRGTRFLERFPYALPNMCAAVIFVFGITTGFLFMEETLETKRDKPDLGRRLGLRLQAFSKKLYMRLGLSGLKNAEVDEDENAPLLAESNGTLQKHADEEDGPLKPSEPTPPPPGFKEVLNRQSVLNLAVYTLLALYSLGFDTLLPVLMHHPPDQPDELPWNPPFQFVRGFGLHNKDIGLMFTLYGAFSMVVQLFVFPPLARYFGVLRCLKAASLTYVVVFLLTPYTVLFPTVTARQAAMYVIMAFKSFAGVFAFPCSTILLTNSATSLRVLGTLNGFATSSSAIGRAIGPSLGGLLFAAGAKRGFIIVPFWALAAIALLAAVPCWMLVEGEGFGADPASDDEAEAEEDNGIMEDEVDSPTRLTAEPAEDQNLLTPESAYGSLAPLSRTSTWSEAMSETDGPSLDRRRSMPLRSSRQNSQTNGASFTAPRRRSSIPVGMGRGFRRLSSNLGQSRSGFGTGSSLGG